MKYTFNSVQKPCHTLCKIEDNFTVTRDDSAYHVHSKYLSCTIVVFKIIYVKSTLPSLIFPINFNTRIRTRTYKRKHDAHTWMLIRKGTQAQTSAYARRNMRANTKALDRTHSGPHTPV